MHGIRSNTSVVLALASCCASFASGQTPLAAPEKGRFLVAGEDLRDPNFFRTVVLLLDYNAEGAIGVIVNRPTPVALTELLPKVEALKRRPDKVHLGGPVNPEGLLLVTRASREPAGFLHAAGEIYYSAAGAESLATLLADDVAPERVRAYAGYAGWGPGQLDRELAQGSWLVMRAAPDPVFDPSPQGLWRRLIDGARVRLAWLGSDALLHLH